MTYDLIIRGGSVIDGTGKETVGSSARQALEERDRERSSVTDSRESELR